MLEVPEVVRYVQLCLLEVLEVPEVMRCVLLCMLEGMEGGLYLLEVLDVLDVLDVPEAMRCVLLFMLEAAEFSKFAGGDALCATLYARGCGVFEFAGGC